MNAAAVPLQAETPRKGRFAETPLPGRFSWDWLVSGAAAVLLGGSWLLPNHYLPWLFFHSEALAFAAVVLWLAALCMGGDRISLPALPVAATLAVLAVVWLQYAGGLVVFIGEAWIATAYLFGLAASLTIGWNWAAAPGSGRVVVDRLVLPIACAGVLSALVSLLQWLRLEEHFGLFVVGLGDFSRPFGNLQQSNLAATLLVMTIAALLWLFEVRRLGAACFALAVLTCSFALVLTESRAGYLAATIIALWWWIGSPGGKPRLHPAYAAAWLAAVFAMALLLPFLHEHLFLGPGEEKRMLGGAGRPVMWRQIMEGVLQSPWWGYGWNATTTAQIAGATVHPGRLSTSFAHNAALDALAWFGLPLGVLLVAGIGLWWVRRAWRARGRLEPVLALMLCLPVIVQSLVEFSFAFMFFLFPLAIAAGAVLRWEERAGEQVVPRWAVAAACAAGALLGALLAREYVPAEEDFRYVRFESLRIGKTPAEHQRFRPVLLTQLGALLEVGYLKPRPGMPQETLELAARVARKYPWPPTQARYAQLLVANDQHELARRELEIVRDLYGPEFYADLVQKIEALRIQWQAENPGRAK